MAAHHSAHIEAWYPYLYLSLGCEDVRDVYGFMGSKEQNAIGPKPAKIAHIAHIKVATRSFDVRGM